jgi:P27 family predicted phage terminase small subunit
MSTGLMGRPRISDEEKKRKGTFRKHREHDPIKFTEIKRVPKAPDALNEIGKEVWKDVCSELIKLSILQVVDINMVLMLCIEMQHYHTCQDDIRDNGLIQTFETKYGIVRKRNPAQEAANGHLKNVMMISSQFGLTPNSRMKLKLGKEEKKKNKAMELIG